MYNYYKPNQYAYIPQQQVWQQPIQPQMPQPIQKQQVIQQPTELPIQSIRYLTGDEIKAYIVMPNTKEMLIDKQNGVAYIKMADQMGQSSCEKYKFEQVVDGEDKVSENSNIEPKINVDNFVTKDMLNEFIAKKDFEKLANQLSEMEKQIKINAILSGDKKELPKGE